MANPEHVAVVRRGARATADWHRDFPSVRMDLRREDFSGADLTEVTIRAADMQDTNFDRALLIRARVSGCNLQRARLRGTNLFGADLRGTNFDDADMESAELRMADLGYASVYRTNLAGIQLGYTQLGGRLAFAKGLESAIHHGPSFIESRQLLDRNWADWMIPDTFLRGCGVPELLVTYRHSMMNPISFYSCFISYSHADKSFALRLHDALQGRGIRCWLDEHELLPGQKVHAEIDRGIRLWDKVLLCASGSSLTSWWVHNEIESAFDKERRLQSERGEEVLVLIPLNLDGHLFKWEDGLATQVKTRLAADFTGWETDDVRFERELERLIAALRADGGGRPPAPTPKL